MKVTKFTHGFVAQVFDTKKNEFVEQNFTAGDEVEWETASGNNFDPDDLDGPEPYLPFDMVQPGVQQALVNAIKVILLTTRTRNFLIEHDPKALEQLTDAINKAGCPLDEDQLNALLVNGFSVTDDGHEQR